MAGKLWIGTDGAYSTNGNWSPTNIPTTGDHVRLPAGGSTITSGLNQSAVAIGDFIGEDGFASVVGVDSGAGTYLQIDPDRFEWSGTGVALIDVSGAVIPANVFNSATGVATGKRGLYLKGSAITTLNVTKGKVGLAVRDAETSAATTARCNGENADLWLGAGVTLTTAECLKGVLRLRCAATTLNIYGGTVYSEEIGTITTVNMYGGIFYPNSTGTITTINLLGGTLDFRKSGAARTVTTLNLKRGASWTIQLNKEAVTYTTIALPDSMQLAGGTIAA